MKYKLPVVAVGGNYHSVPAELRLNTEDFLKVVRYQPIPIPQEIAQVCVGKLIKIVDQATNIHINRVLHTVLGDYGYWQQ